MGKELCEICLKFGEIDRHHIVGRSYFGSNSSYNSAKICPNCHRLVHLGELVLEGKFSYCSSSFSSLSSSSSSSQDFGKLLLVWHARGEVSVTGRPTPAVHLLPTAAPLHIEDLKTWLNTLPPSPSLKTPAQSLEELL